MLYTIFYILYSIYYMLDNILVFFSLSALCIEASTELKIGHDKEIFQDVENFKDMKDLVLKRLESHVEIHPNGIFHDMEMFLDLEVIKYGLNLTTIGSRKKL